ncbi:MAG: hypothetical protein V1822_01770, partial [Candidatus Micrarchaeota archaeon]
MKKLVFAALALSLFLLFAGCISQVGKEDLQAGQNIQNSSAEQMQGQAAQNNDAPCQNENGMQKAFCYADLAIQEGDVKICGGIIVENNTVQQQLDIDYCVAKFAFNSKNSSLCSRINSSSLKDACYIDLARALDDPKVCDEVADLQNRHENCYVQMATDENSTQICSMISDPDYSAFCMARIEGEPEYCAGINSSYVSDLCNLHLAWGKNDWQICAGIKDDDMLHDTCIAAIASA